ncbi:hypothetical protein [Pontibacter pamirensis]|uniref:hypothetical protein n=1 Tax=Pontibacter pamirensis TaxID=2562824 RepID=UPI001389EB0C|nr:hypothetical protein [Pontibacter pamirensis]
MTANQFNSDSPEERTKLVWSRGEFLAVRQRHGCTVVLYHLQEIFAEVWYHPESNVLLMVHGYDKHTCLEPYLESIDLRELTSE